MANSENISQNVEVNLILPLIESLSSKDLQELFIDISQKFTSKLDDCKEINELKRLQGYLRIITAEIKAREKRSQAPSTS